jgi:membrane protease YdiL (CAAX protease family)
LNRRLLAWWALVLTIGGLALAVRLTSPPENERVPPFFTWSFGLGGLVQYAVWFGLVLAIAAGLRRREAFALRRPSSLGRAVRFALVAIAVAGVTSAIVGPLLNPGKEQGILPKRWVHGHIGPFVVSVVAVAVVAPIVEELMFRGLGFSLLRKYGRRVAILAVGLAFGVAHGIPEALPILVPFGSALAYVRDRTGSVYPGMVVHALFNTVAVILAVA